MYIHPTSSTRTRRGGSCLKDIYIYIYLKKKPFSSIELACAVRQPSPCVRAFCESGVLFLMSHLKLHFALHISHCTLHTPHFTLHTPHFTLRTALLRLLTSHSTLHSPHFTSHCTLKTPDFTLHTSHFTVHTSTSHCFLHTPHFTLHTPHFTLHPSRPTLHTALFTLDTSSELFSPHPSSSLFNSYVI